MSPKWRWAGLSVLVPLLLLVGCGGGSRVKGGGFDAPPSTAGGFPFSQLEGDVAVEASFTSKHADIFGWDMVPKGVLPVELKVGLRKTKDESALIRVDPGDTGMRLYLSDGSVLEALSGDEVAAKVKATKLKKRVTDLALGVSMLSDWSESKSRSFVFFQLVGVKSPKVRGSRLTYVKGGRPYEVELTNALLSFNLVIDNRTSPIYVGVGN